MGQNNMAESKIIAAIVAYNPDEKIFRNIRAISPQVEGIVVIDNSDKGLNWKRRLDSIPVHHINAGGNLGVATALNKALEHAVSVGATWMLTLDQDSIVEADYIKKLRRYIEQSAYGGRDLVSVGGVPVDPENAYRILTALPGMSAPHLITSGNLIRIDALTEIGRYPDELFIDYVDLWVSMALCSYGYRVAQCEDAVFEHSLGASSYGSLFGKQIRLSNHSAIRRYYITRNRILFWGEALSHGGSYLPSEFRQFVVDCIALTLEEDRLRKLQAMMFALFDVIAGKRGKCSYNL